MIIDIGCETIDFSKVERVGSIYGDPGRYDVYFASGGRTIILVDCDSVGTNKMKREDFISKWKVNSILVIGSCSYFKTTSPS